MAPQAVRDYRKEQAAMLGLNDQELSDEELFGGDGEISDEELFGGDGEISDEELFGGDQPPPVDDRSDAEKGAGWAINILDTITPSWGDEIVSAPAALWGGYNEEQKKAHEIQRRYRQFEPWDSKRNLGSTALGIAGGIAPAAKVFNAGRALLGGAAAKGALAKGAQSLGALGLTGAAYAGINEAGDAEGGLPERAQAVADNPEALAVGGALGLAAGPLGVGGTKLAQGTGRVVTNMLRSAEGRGARHIAEQLVTAGMTPEELAAAHARAAKTGKPVNLADVGPQEVRDAAGAAGRGPGGREVAQKTIGQRQEGQVGRVGEDVGQATGGQPGSFTQTVDDISAKQAAEAKPLYQRALGGNKPVKSAKLVEITNRPSGKAAMDRGLKIARDKGIPEEELVLRDKDGNVTGYSAKALHYMKLALDDMIESSMRSGDNSAARAYSIMKSELLGEMDRNIPGYAQARKVFAGHAANKRALEQGRQAVNKHPDEIASEMSNMSIAERAMYRRGFAQRVIEQAEATGDFGNAARKIMGNTAKRERLRAVLGDDEYNRLMERLDLEDRMYQTWAQVGGNSATAQRQTAEQAMLASIPDEGLVGGLAQAATTGNVSPLLRSIGMQGIARLLRRMAPKVRGEVARMLFSTNPAEVRTAVKLIQQHYDAALRAQQLTQAGGAVAATHPQETLAGAGVAGTVASEATAPVSPLW